MPEKHFIDMTPKQYQSYLSSKKEKDFLLVDVRQPPEYEQTHIPGASLLPLSEFESRVFDLPSDKELIFYCKSGNRSQMAAMLADEAEITERSIYHLAGGILAWTGKTVGHFPKVKMFAAAGSFEELLYTAMDMERGAERFYQHMRDQYADYPFAQTFDQLSKVETAHARIIYDVYKKSAATEPEPFDTLYQKLSGEIMEGGESLDQMASKLESIDSHVCASLMEIALNIEYAAYDLYRNAAVEYVESREAADLFLDIAQAEKTHMRIIAKALADCG
ncbi:MAG TPA: rhodanese-like domain-containing protein [Desulfosalsimonadaceae bacterium]|nr:rhodanese-like domain-containing protein [Desulfosalsimonadaceae bacterium]